MFISRKSQGDGLVLFAGPAMRYYFPDTGALGLDKILIWALDSSPLALWSMVIFPLSRIALMSALGHVWTYMDPARLQQPV